MSDTKCTECRRTIGTGHKLDCSKGRVADDFAEDRRVIEAATEGPCGAKDALASIDYRCTGCGAIGPSDDGHRWMGGPVSGGGFSVTHWCPDTDPELPFTIGWSSAIPAALDRIEELERENARERHLHEGDHEILAIVTGVESAHMWQPAQAKIWRASHDALLNERESDLRRIAKLEERVKYEQGLVSESRERIAALEAENKALKERRGQLRRENRRLLLRALEAERENERLREEREDNKPVEGELRRAVTMARDALIELGAKSDNTALQACCFAVGDPKETP